MFYSKLDWIAMQGLHEHLLELLFTHLTKQYHWLKLDNSKNAFSSF